MGMLLHLISAITGCVTILASLYLIYEKILTLDKVSSSMEDEVIKAQIFDVVKISSNRPALALFIIGIILILVPVLKYQAVAISYTVSGTIIKEDGEPARDVQIISRYPPLYPSPSGAIVNLQVWKSPDGRFPVVSFVHPDYSVTPVDLNDSKVVEFNDGKIHIKSEVTLNSLPGD